MDSATDFQPNWASSPGDTIADILREQQIPITKFAERMGGTPEYVRELLNGYIAITNEIAVKLERVLGATAEFWLNRESQYKRSIERLKTEEEAKWIEELPVRDMIKLGWLKDTGNKIKACLDYFNVPDVASYRTKYREVVGITSFRTSPTFKSQPGAVSAWIRQGEIRSSSIQCKPWNAKLFERTLTEIRALTRKKYPKDFLPPLIEACAKCGVAVAIVRTPVGCKASGATMFVSADRALMLLSFRYRSDDHFWFTFFHEAGHILLHGNKSIFIEEGSDQVESPQEKEANFFAAEMLIPHDLQPALGTIRSNQRRLLSFAMQAGVSPGIVVGQLQHRGFIPHNYLNSYKRHYDWDDIE